jgi:hypothetical protein
MKTTKRLSFSDLLVFFPHLDYLIAGLESLLCGGAARLYRRHKDAAVVAAGEADADGTVLLEADEPWVRPVVVKRKRFICRTLLHVSLHRTT